MRKTMATITVVLCLALANSAFAHEHGDEQEVAPQSAHGLKVENPAKCQNCGMDRTAFAASRVLITFADGTTVGTCSINCAHDEVTRNVSKKIKNIKVADYTSKKLIDAKKATWIIGGNKQGVMSATAKWAFEDRAGAERFIKENGGKIATFDEAWKAAAR
jgi:nitrous oxide reductase accessory protein NosL